MKAVRLGELVVTDNQLELLSRQEKLRDWLGHPGTGIVVNELRLVARNSMMKQYKYNPFTEPEKIVQERLLVHVLNVVLPEIIERIVNYDPDAPDRQLSPKKRWNLLEWLRNLWRSKQKG